MTEGVQAADEVRVPLGASAPGPAAAAASPASPGAPGPEAERGSGPSASPPESPAAERGADLGADEEQPVPYPALAATVFFCLGQTTRPRSWCLRLVCNPYPSRASGGAGILGMGLRGAGPPPACASHAGALWPWRGLGARRTRYRGARGALLRERRPRAALCRAAAAALLIQNGVSPLQSQLRTREGGIEAARPSRAWWPGGKWALPAPPWVPVRTGIPPSGFTGPPA